MVDHLVILVHSTMAWTVSIVPNAKVSEAKAGTCSKRGPGCNLWNVVAKWPLIVRFSSWLLVILKETLLSAYTLQIPWGPSCHGKRDQQTHLLQIFMLPFARLGGGSSFLWSLYLDLQGISHERGISEFPLLEALLIKSYTWFSSYRKNSRTATWIVSLFLY